MFLLHDLEQRRTERTLQPAAHHRERSLVVVEMRHKLARKMRRRLRIPVHESFHYFEQSRRSVSDGRDKPVCPEIGLLAFPLLLVDLDRERAKTFEQLQS